MTQHSRWKWREVALVGACMASGVAAASVPLTLSYSVADAGGGRYNYEFEMVLDNHDGTWAPGQGWGWIIFGDALNGPSMLSDFQGDVSDLPVGPWNEYSSSSGEHNGPTFAFILNMWQPTAIGQTLRWSGTSASLVPPGAMKWSSLFSTGGASTFSFEVAVEGGGGTGCAADYDHDGFLTGDDFDLYVAAFELGDASADFNRDGFVTGDDFDLYVSAFVTGC